MNKAGKRGGGVGCKSMTASRNDEQFGLDARLQCKNKCTNNETPLLRCIDPEQNTLELVLSSCYRTSLPAMARWIIPVRYNTSDKLYPDDESAFDDSQLSRDCTFCTGM